MRFWLRQPERQVWTYSTCAESVSSWIWSQVDAGWSWVAANRQMYHKKNLPQISPEEETLYRAMYQCCLTPRWLPAFDKSCQYSVILHLQNSKPVIQWQTCLTSMCTNKRNISETRIKWRNFLAEDPRLKSAPFNRTTSLPGSLGAPLASDSFLKHFEVHSGYPCALSHF